MSTATVDLEALEARIRAMPKEKREELRRKVQVTASRPWLPQPGPQTAAYYCEADETLYGGAAGGGKTDLLLGLATTQHKRSVIYRRQSTDLKNIWNRLITLIAGRYTQSNASTKYLTMADGRFIEFGHLEKPGSEMGWQGNPHDFYGFDEGAQLDPNKVLFVTRWNRSEDPKQRCRIVIATNPPIPEYDDAGNLIDTGTGAWLKEWFAPWLEEAYFDPAEPGELRWCYMKTEGDRMVTVWVDGPGCYDLATGVYMPDATQADIDAGRVIVARSRTFIKALLKDNAFYKGTGYAARLSSTPEPLRSLLLNGSFSVRGEDHPMQVIPTMYALKAQERWRTATANDAHLELRQLVLSGDIAQGGVDTTVIAELYDDDFFGEPLAQPGSKTPTGFEVQQLVLGRRRDGSLVVLDGTGGWAGSTRDLLLRDQQIEAEMFIASEAANEWTPDGRWKYANNRTKMWWEFRLALDPRSTYKIKLPLNSRLLAQLTTPHFRIDGNVLYIESKIEIRKRLAGSSTDEADAVLQAWQYRDQAIARLNTYEPDIIERIVFGKTKKMKQEERYRPAEFDDPLKDFR